MTILILKFERCSSLYWRKSMTYECKATCFYFLLSVVFTLKPFEKNALIRWKFNSNENLIVVVYFERKAIIVSLFFSFLIAWHM